MHRCLGRTGPVYVHTRNVRIIYLIVWLVTISCVHCAVHVCLVFCVHGHYTLSCRVAKRVGPRLWKKSVSRSVDPSDRSGYVTLLYYGVSKMYLTTNTVRLKCDAHEHSLIFFWNRRIFHFTYTHKSTHLFIPYTLRFVAYSLFGCNSNDRNRIQKSPHLLLSFSL